MRRLIAWIIEWWDELRWTMQFNSPRGRKALNKLAGEVRQQIATSQVEDGGFGGE